MTFFWQNPLLANQRRQCRAISSVGDVDPIEYGGGFIFQCRSAGQPQPYDYDLEYTHGIESDGERQLTVYRESIPTGDVWEYYNWAKISDVARTHGASVAELRKLGGSTDPNDPGNAVGKAAAMLMIAGHYGWENLDSYPLQMRPAELRARWRAALRKKL